jgi:S1-C subfamily serine protease
VLVVDVVLIVVLVLAVVAGAARGLVASLGTLVGLIAGGAAVYWLAPIVSAAVAWPVWRAVVVVAMSIALLVGGAALGSLLGGLVRRGVDRTALRGVDRFLGAAASLVIAALATSLVGSSLAATGIPTVSSAVASSRVLGVIDDLTPDPVAATLARLRGDVLGAGLPSLGILLAPEAVPRAEPVALDDPELAAAAASVARVVGTAYACGISLTGTGFVVSPGRLVTNAHVVAGVDAPVVELPGGEVREGRVVYFDPTDDLAVIAVDELDASPLAFTDTLPVGASAVVQGYPYGGPFTQTPAQVLSVGEASVPDIDESGSSVRSVYALAAAVEPGDSGGPLLNEDGAVAGVVFARGQDDESRGYAMTMAELTPVVALAPGLDEAVATGGCRG